MRKRQNKINKSIIKKKKWDVLFKRFNSKYNSNISHSYNFKDSNYNINNNSLKRFNDKYWERMLRNNKKIIEEYKEKIIKLRK